MQGQPEELDVVEQGALQAALRLHFSLLFRYEPLMSSRLAMPE
jgi:hypothetical protein